MPIVEIEQEQQILSESDIYDSRSKNIPTFLNALVVDGINIHNISMYT
jgi:hypothetical protein